MPGRLFGFFGLDVLLLFIAFRINYRRAAAFEEVTVTPSALTVRKVSHNGGHSNGRSTRCGRGSKKTSTKNTASPGCFWSAMASNSPSPVFLAPTKRPVFAEAHTRALGDAKRGPVRTALP